MAPNGTWSNSQHDEFCRQLLWPPQAQATFLFLCVSLRTSASSAVQAFDTTKNAETAEVRRGRGGNQLLDGHVLRAQSHALTLSADVVQVGA